MKSSQNRAWIALLGVLAVGLGVAWHGARSDGREPHAAQPATPAADDRPHSAAEARGRAKLLHETFHATLHMVHQQYYRADEGLPLPAALLKDVFQELEDSQQVRLHWLAVNAQPMNLDHMPRNDFEKRAVKALADGQEEAEQTDPGLYRRAAVICLTNDCLKCHLPNRTSTEDRSAGLVIEIPLAPQ